MTQTATMEDYLSASKLSVWEECPPLARPYPIRIVSGEKGFLGCATCYDIQIHEKVCQPDFSKHDRKFTLVHEILHWLLEHPERMTYYLKNCIYKIPKTLILAISQICADAIVNDLATKLCPSINLSDPELHKHGVVITFDTVQKLVDNLADKANVKKVKYDLKDMTLEMMLDCICSLFERLLNQQAQQQPQMPVNVMPSSGSSSSSSSTNNQLSGTNTSTSQSGGKTKKKSKSQQVQSNSQGSGENSSNDQQQSSGSGGSKEDYEKFVDELIKDWKTLYDAAGHKDLEELLKELMDSDSGKQDEQDNNSGQAGNGKINDGELSGLESVFKKYWMEEILQHLAKKDGIGTEHLPGYLKKVQPMTVEDIYYQILDFLVQAHHHSLTVQNDFYTDVDWSRPRRYSFSDILEPSIIYCGPKAAIVLDVSGSMTSIVEKDYDRTAKAVGAILNLAKFLNIAKLIEFDTDICRELDLTQCANISDVLSTVTQGGGTAMDAAIEVMIKKIKTSMPDTKFLFVVTDCETDWPSSPPEGVYVCIINVGTEEWGKKAPSFFKVVQV
jgi:predicted metal-dependent peptidase